MKKITIPIFIFVLIIFSFLFYKKYEVDEMRSKITEISSTEGYNKELKENINDLLEIGNLRPIHISWIEPFVLENLFNGDLEDASYHFIIKLQNKNIELTIEEKYEIRSKLSEIKTLTVYRKEEVDNLIKQYLEFREKSINKEIELFFYDAKVKTNEIKYY